MNRLTSQLSPSITKMIRMDHAHVMALFHQFHAATPRQQKQGLVNTACIALEIHAQLEEEVFYPALRALPSVQAMVADKAVPEHLEARRLAAALRVMAPDDPAYDASFMALMRDVMHHVANEETVLLPAAETELAERLGELGAEMTRRRVQLLGARAGDVALNTLRSMPQSGMVLAAGAVAAGAYLFGPTGGRRSR
jgi:hemerythrin superfamily protein